MGRLSISQNSELAIKEIKSIASTGSAPSTPQRSGINNGSKVAAGIPAAASGLKRSSSKSQGTTNRSAFNKSDVVPVIVPRASSRVELASDSRKETGGAKTLPNNMQSKISELRKFSNIKDDTGVTNTTGQSETTSNKNIEPREVTDSNFLSASNGVNQPAVASDRSVGDVRDIGAAKLGVSPAVEPNPSCSNDNYDIRVHKPRDASSSEVLKGGRTKSLVASWERREQSPLYGESIPSSSPETVSATMKSFTLRRSRSFAEKETVSASDEDAIADLMDQHEQFISSAQSRLTKLQVVRRVWERNDIKGVISAMEKMSDYAVSADILSVLMGKSDNITLDLCTRLLPLITRLLDSKIDRHLCIFLEMALKLVRTFGPVIHSTVSASRSSVGVDLQAEQRLERCNLCFIELEKIKNSLPAFTRIGGMVSKSAMELNLALQEVL